MVRDHLMAVLATVFELSIYALYLQSSPAMEAALLLPKPEKKQLQEAQAEVMRKSKLQWETVLAMEAKAPENALLRAMCPYTRYTNFREVLTVLEGADWTMTETATKVLKAWHPGLAFSANVEQVFNSLEDVCKRANKNARSSMPNLQCLSIRATGQKLCKGSPSPAGVELAPEDYEGKDIRSIKSSVWKPESFSGSA